MRNLTDIEKEFNQILAKNDPTLKTKKLVELMNELEIEHKAFKIYVNQEELNQDLETNKSIALYHKISNARDL